MQPNENGKLQPVAFTSCQMRPNEEVWAQIEKECLAIVAACNKWDQWIYGLDVTVHTDHQPLETIFKKPLNAAPRRLQKMLMQLQRYNLTVTYKKGSTLHLADTLSRATLPDQNEIFRIDLQDTAPPNEGITSLTLLRLKEYKPSRMTTCNSLLLQWSQGGLPPKINLTPPLHLFGTFVMN